MDRISWKTFQEWSFPAVSWYGEGFVEGDLHSLSLWKSYIGPPPATPPSEGSLAYTPHIITTTITTTGRLGTTHHHLNPNAKLLSTKVGGRLPLASPRHGPTVPKAKVIPPGQTSKFPTFFLSFSLLKDIISTVSNAKQNNEWENKDWGSTNWGKLKGRRMNKESIRPRLSQSGNVYWKELSRQIRHFHSLFSFPKT